MQLSYQSEITRREFVGRAVAGVAGVSALLGDSPHVALAGSLSTHPAIAAGISGSFGHHVRTRVGLMPSCQAGKRWKAWRTYDNAPEVDTG